MNFAVHFFKKIPMWGIESLVKKTWLAKNTQNSKIYFAMAKEQMKRPSADRGRSDLAKWERASPSTAETPAPAAPDVVMKGPLEKHTRRTVFAHWRDCELRENGVFTYATQSKDHRVLGSLDVRGGTVKKTDTGSFDFVLTRKNGNAIRFVAKTQADVDKWVFALYKRDPGVPPRREVARERFPLGPPTASTTPSMRRQDAASHGFGVSCACFGGTQLATSIDPGVDA